MKRILICLLVASLVLAGCSWTSPQSGQGNGSEKEPAIPQEEKPPTEEEILREKVDSMTREEKLGQLVMAGLEGKEISDRERELLREYHIGGFILFGRNISDKEGTRDLIDSLKAENESSHLPLLIGIDEEGGLVTRLSGIYRNLPSMSFLGDRPDANLAYQYGSIQGQKLKSLGINVNFSPVLDVNSNPGNPVIGDRSIGSDPEIVADLGVQVANGIGDQDVVPVGKHFPGHGDTKSDSHISLPVINKSIQDLLELELVPFLNAIQENIPALMVGHLMIPEIDDLPSSLSNKTINELLRQDMGFGGVVFSDDLTMGAITENMSASQAAVQFILAGGDVALICHGETTAIEALAALHKAWEDGSLTDEMIDGKVMRIIKLKRDFGIEDSPVPRDVDNIIDEKIGVLFD